MTKSFSSHRFISFDQTPIFYRIFAPASAPRAVVFLVHGMGEHGARYEPLAKYLAGLDYECWVPDLRGFGRSGGAKGAVSAFSDYEKDLDALYCLAERTRPGLPLFLLGHSFGGLICAHMPAHYRLARLKGLILSSPLFGVAQRVPIWKDVLAKTASILFPAFTQNNGVSADLLTHDLPMRDSHKNDKLIHFRISARLYTEMQKAIAGNLALAEATHCPALVLQAGDDKIVSRKKTELFYDRLASCDKELKIFEGWYHEILNEVDRSQVFTKISDWLTKHS